ncbi:MAG: hypothetical protein AB1656_05075 [Candidatus Omnitrophota bacterium]
MYVHIVTTDMGWGGALMDGIGKALAENGHSIGWRAHGPYTHVEEKCDAIITIGMAPVTMGLIEDCKRKNVQLFLITDGFLKRHGDRLTERYWAVGRNSFHAYGRPVDFLVPGDRWERLGVEMQPWRNEGKYILVAHQYTSVPLYNIDKRPYFERAYEEIRKYTDRPFKIRKHPLDKGRTATPEGFAESFSVGEQAESFEEALRDAWCVLTYDSNAALEAILRGVPAFTLGKCLADPAANKDLSRIENPLRPDRQQWAHWIAYAQWSGAELRDYAAWRVLLDNEYQRVDEPAHENDLRRSASPPGAMDGQALPAAPVHPQADTAKSNKKTANKSPRPAKTAAA